MTETTPEPEAPDIRVTAYIAKGGEDWEAWTYPGIGTLSVTGETEDATKAAMVQAYNALEDTQWAADQFGWESGE